MDKFLKKIDKYSKSGFKNRVRVYLENLDEDKFVKTDDEDLMDLYDSLGTDEAEKESLNLAIKRVVKEQESFILYLEELYGQSILLNQAKEDLEFLKKINVDNYPTLS